MGGAQGTRMQAWAGWVLVGALWELVCGAQVAGGWGQVGPGGAQSTRMQARARLWGCDACTTVVIPTAWHTGWHSNRGQRVSRACHWRCTRAGVPHHPRDDHAAPAAAGGRRAARGRVWEQQQQQQQQQQWMVVGVGWAAA